MKIYRISFSRTSKSSYDHICSGLTEVTEKAIPQMKCQYDPETGMIFCWYCLSPIAPEQLGCICPESSSIITVFAELDSLARRYLWIMLNPQKVNSCSIAHNIRTSRSVLEAVLCHSDAREQLGKEKCQKMEEILTA